VRRLALTLALAGAVATGCGSGEPERSASPASFERLADAPPPLAALYRRPSALLDGGKEAFQEQLRKLRGFPVVVNAWASWCGPCRFEFPFFQRQAVKRGKRIAFLGVNSQDHEPDAREFLAEYPLPFPSYKDPDEEVARVFGVAFLPSTGFYDRRGKLAYLHQGGYQSEAALAEDIERYAR
jgi:cytochrome c biogenesis protein CcmG/thiol:disulfide interchange protein DsbE